MCYNEVQSQSESLTNVAEVLCVNIHGLIFQPDSLRHMKTIYDILKEFRDESFSEKYKGIRFERLMRAWLKTDPRYTGLFETVWLWEEFPFRDELGGTDTGIDLVA